MLKDSVKWGYLIGDFAEKLQEELKPQLTDPDIEADVASDLNRLIRALEDMSSMLQDL